MRSASKSWSAVPVERRFDHSGPLVSDVRSPVKWTMGRTGGDDLKVAVIAALTSLWAVTWYVEVTSTAWASTVSSGKHRGSGSFTASVGVVGYEADDLELWGFAHSPSASSGSSSWPVEITNVGARCRAMSARAFLSRSPLPPSRTTTASAWTCISRRGPHERRAVAPRNNVAATRIGTQTRFRRSNLIPCLNALVATRSRRGQICRSRSGLRVVDNVVVEPVARP